MIWETSWKADPRAREVADRHYNRQKPGTPQFVPPGRALVLYAETETGARVLDYLVSVCTIRPPRMGGSVGMLGFQK